MGQPKRQPAKEGKPERSQKQTSTSKRERNVQGDSKRKSQKKPESAAADTAAQQAESTTHGEVSAFAWPAFWQAAAQGRPHAHGALQN